MDQVHKDKLRKNRVAIVEHMQEVETIVDHLLQERVITSEFSEKVKTIRVRANQVREILDYIPAKIKGYSVFVEALRQTGNDGVLKALGEQTDESGSSGKEETSKPLVMKHYAKGKLSISSVSASAVRRDPNLCYNMTRKPRGNVLLLEVKNFADGSVRRGSEFDRDAVHELFTKLDFKIHDKSDPTADEMKEAVVNFANNDCHRNADCAVVVAMSHGQINQIFAHDQQLVKIQEEIIDPINLCPALRDKPKIFIFQTCRVNGDETDGPTDATVVLQDLKISKPKADTIVAWATVEGEEAFRRLDNGSWFIQSLVSVFSDYAHTEDVLSMLTMVNSVVGDQVSDRGKKQVCKMESTLVKKIFFNPGYSE